MKRKNLIGLIVVAILVAVAGYFYTQQGTGDFRTDKTEFGFADTTAVTKVFLADRGDRTVTLEKNEFGVWMVNGTHKARPDAIELLMSTIARLKVKAPVPLAARENVIRKMGATNTKVEIYAGSDKPAKVYYVGHESKDSKGNYMLLEGAKYPYLVYMPGFRGFPAARFFTNWKEWRSRQIWSYAQGNVAKVKVEILDLPKQSFTIDVDVNNNATLIDSDGKTVNQYDSVNAYRYTTQFEDISFENIAETLEENELDSIRKLIPIKTYAVTDYQGNTTEIKTYLKKAPPAGVDFSDKPIDFDVDRMYAQLEDGTIVVIQYYVFDKLDARLSDFLPRQ